MKKFNRTGLRKVFFLSNLTLCLTVSLFGNLDDEESENIYIYKNSQLSYQMLDHTENLRKVEILLKARENNEITNESLYLGFSIIGIADYQKSNTNSKFSYLMRHPTSNNQIGKQASEAVIHSAQFSFTGTVNNWITAYGEVLYDPEQSFGSGTIATLTRNQLQLRKGYALLGDFKQFTFYFALGKMDAPFGQTSSVNPFTSSTMWHAFGGLGYGALFGYDKNGVNLSFMAVQGGAQFRALHTPVDETAVPSRINNFVVDANYTYHLNETSEFLFGASYEKGSAYCQEFPISHFAACNKGNPAWAAYTKYASKNLIIKAGFAKTTGAWPGSHNPNAPLNEFAASKVSSFDIGAKYTFYRKENMQYAGSYEFSNFVAGPNKSPWKRQDQHVLGFSGTYKNSSKLFFELFRTDGYAPLNFMSGGNFADLGKTHSTSEAHSMGVVIGFQLTI
jgi:hypothetical protein